MKMNRGDRLVHFLALLLLLTLSVCPVGASAANLTGLDIAPKSATRNIEALNESAVHPESVEG